MTEMLRQIFRLRRLTLREWILLAVALPTVAAVRLALWVLPFRILWKIIEQFPTLSSRATDGDGPGASRVERGTGFHTSRSLLLGRRALRVARSVRAVSHLVPRATCLTQALATRMLLVGRGCPLQLRIGVRHQSGSRIEAHAWVEYQGYIIIGDMPDLDTFRPLNLTLPTHCVTEAGNT